VGRDGQSAVEKVRRVLDCFIRDGTFSMRFAQILEGSGVSRASLHRTLSDMVANGLLSQADRREEYRLGPLLRSAGTLAAAASSVRSAARPHMERLRDECRETIVLAELHDASVVPLLRADGLHEMRMNQTVGRRYPAHAGATGKVLLAHLPTEELEALLAEAELKPLTPDTTTDRERLAAELKLIASAGVGVSLGERVPDAVAISAPVFDPEGRAVAALTISGIASRYSRERLVADSVAVREVAQAISVDLGYPPPAGPGLNDPSAAPRRALETMADAALERSAGRAVAPAPA
jgi:IclR family transcriptional regulator, acetate operon repressor